ncbi:UNVERIFIED_CONTAM: hypothetical protein FKN15_007959 [Acipenser sinensis]
MAEHIVRLERDKVRLLAENEQLKRQIKLMKENQELRKLLSHSYSKIQKTEDKYSEATNETAFNNFQAAPLGGHGKIRRNTILYVHSVARTGVGVRAGR